MDLKNKYKMLVVDFDGTLVDTDFHLSSVLKQEIKRLKDKGIFFVIVTGRRYQGIVRNVCKSLKLEALQIVNGGAEIVDPLTDQIIWHEYLASKNAQKIITYFLSQNLKFSVDSQGYVFITSGIRSKEFGPDIIFKDIKEVKYDLIAKISLEKNGIQDLKEKSERLLKMFKDLYIVRSGMKGLPVLDITSIKATKHFAVLELSKILKIDPQFIIGVGDGYNDYPLLSVCGLKVAMDNAPKQLKDIADLILSDVSHGGLITLLNNL